MTELTEAAVIEALAENNDGSLRGASISKVFVPSDLYGKAREIFGNEVEIILDDGIMPGEWVIAPSEEAYKVALQSQWHQAAAKKSAELKQWLIDQFGAVEGKRSSRTEKGTKYKHFESCIVGDPKIHAGSAQDIEGVAQEWMEFVTEFAQDHSGQMVVRRWPEISISIDTPCLISARLAIE